MYADQNAWELSDGVQSLYVSALGKCVGRIFREIHPPILGSAEKIRWIDLACGTALIPKAAAPFLKEMEVSYFGIDLDEIALARASFALRSETWQTELRLESVMDAEFGSSGPFSNVYTCFSNTFLTFGGETALVKLLRKLRDQGGSRPVLVLGVVPWDELREKYHDAFRSWMPVSASNRAYSVRNDWEIQGNRVSQIVFLRKGNSEGRIKHEFERLSMEEISRLLCRSGWDIRRIYNPFTAEEADPKKTIVPEFYLYCEAR